MKALRILVLIAVLVVTLFWIRPMLAARAERKYFTALASQVQEGMDSKEALSAVNKWMSDHPQGNGALSGSRQSRNRKEQIENFVLTGANGCRLEVNFEGDQVAEIVRTGF